MFAKTLYCNCILTSLNFDFLLVPSSNLLHLLITIITLIFEYTKLFKLHYILQNFCASLSPPSYVIEVQSEAENDWIVELSKYSPRYRSFCSFFRNEFYGSRNLIHLRSLLYICCFFQDFPSICLKVFYMQSLNKLYIKGRLKCKVQLIIYCLNNRRP